MCCNGTAVEGVNVGGTVLQFESRFFSAKTGAPDRLPPVQIDHPAPELNF